MFWNKNNTEYVTLCSEKIHFPIYYEVHQEVSTIMNNINMNVMETDIILRIDSFEKIDNGYRISLISEKYELSKYDSKYSKLINVLIAFNIPTSKLDLLLDTNGIPCRVLNQEEIKYKWNNLKNGDLSFYKNNEQTSKILDAGDKDFSNTLPVLLSSGLYIIFFPPIYGLKNNRFFFFNSQIYPNNKLKYEQELTIDSYSNIDATFHDESSGIPESDFSELYKKIYLPLFGTNYLYSNLYKVQYKYDIQKGIMIYAKALFHETTDKDNNLVSKQTISIKTKM